MRAMVAAGKVQPKGDAKAGSVIAEFSVLCTDMKRASVHDNLSRMRVKADGGTLNLASVPVLSMTMPQERILVVSVACR